MNTEQEQVIYSWVEKVSGYWYGKEQPNMARQEFINVSVRAIKQAFKSAATPPDVEHLGKWVKASERLPKDFWQGRFRDIRDDSLYERRGIHELSKGRFSTGSFIIPSRFVEWFEAGQSAVQDATVFDLLNNLTLFGGKVMAADGLSEDEINSAVNEDRVYKTQGLGLMYVWMPEGSQDATPPTNKQPIIEEVLLKWFTEAGCGIDQLTGAQFEAISGAMLEIYTTGQNISKSALDNEVLKDELISAVSGRAKGDGIEWNMCYEIIDRAKELIISQDATPLPTWVKYLGKRVVFGYEGSKRGGKFVGYHPLWGVVIFDPKSPIVPHKYVTEDLIEWPEGSQDATPQEWEKALISLTPGGSEYVGDPARCVEAVKDFRDIQHSQIVKLTKELSTLRSELSAAQEENKRLREALEGFATSQEAGFHGMDYDEQELLLQKIVDEINTSSNLHSKGLIRRLLNNTQFSNEVHDKGKHF